ncbi:hypothetical protein ACHAWF_014797 [Thalassiosira exigua]
MGNAVIAGILFQPPSPPNRLEGLEPHPNDAGENDTAAARTSPKRRHGNLDVEYLWLHTVDDSDGSTRLIPALHVSHRDEVADPAFNFDDLGNLGPGSIHPDLPDDEARIAQHLVQQIRAQLARQGSGGVGGGAGGPGAGGAAGRRYTLLYSHGNAEDLGLISSFLVDLARLLGVDVLCYDYAGYGVSGDESYAAEFYDRCGGEVARWREWRHGRGGEEEAARRRWSREVFAAPVVQPPEPRDAAEDPAADGEGAPTDPRDSPENEPELAPEGDDEGGYDSLCGWHDESPPSSDRATAGECSASAEPPVPATSRTDDRSRRRSILSRHKWDRPRPSEEGCYLDVRAAYDYLVSARSVPPRHVVLYGKSVGSGPTCWLAQGLCAEESSRKRGSARRAARNEESRGDAEEGRGDDASCDIDGSSCGAGEFFSGDAEGRDSTARGREGDGDDGGEGGPSREDHRNGGAEAGPSGAPGGVVLHSPFLSVIRVVLDVGFTTVGDLFPNVDRVGDFTCPVYVIHGSQDAIVPFYHGQRLFQALPDSSKTVPFWARGAGHNNIEMDMPTAYVKRLQQFVRQCDRANYPDDGGTREQRERQVRRLRALKAQQDAMRSRQRELQDAIARTSLREGQVVGGAGGGARTRDGRPVYHRYASESSYHLMGQSDAAVVAPAALSSVGSGGGSGGGGRKHLSASDRGSGGGSHKQRKKRGTLVMRSPPEQPRHQSPRRPRRAAGPTSMPPPSRGQRGGGGAGGVGATAASSTLTGVAAEQSLRRAMREAMRMREQGAGGLSQSERAVVGAPVLDAAAPAATRGQQPRRAPRRMAPAGDRLEI